MDTTQHVAFRATPADLRLLRVLTAHLGETTSAILRRALRDTARELGLPAEPITPDRRYEKRRRGKE